MKKFIRIAILMTLGFSLLLSCGGRHFEKSVEEFSGSEIELRKLQQIFIGCDSSVVRLDSIPVLLVIYKDKNECVPCQIGQLGKYRKMVDFKQDVGDGYAVVFIFSPLGTVNVVLENQTTSEIQNYVGNSSAGVMVIPVMPNSAYRMDIMTDSGRTFYATFSSRVEDENFNELNLSCKL